MPSKRRTLADSRSGIRVKGAFSSNAKITVTKGNLHHEGTCNACDAIRERTKTQKLIALHDISASGYNGGVVTVTIPIGTEHNGRIFMVMHCNSGMLEEKEITCVDNAITSNWDGLSPFAVLERASFDTPKELVIDPPKTGGESSSWISILLVAVTSLMFRLVKRLRLGKGI